MNGVPADYDYYYYFLDFLWSEIRRSALPLSIRLGQGCFILVGRAGRAGSYGVVIYHLFFLLLMTLLWCDMAGEQLLHLKCILLSLKQFKSRPT